MPRQARLDATGTLHHVILRGIEKGIIVGDQKDRKEFVKRMGEIAVKTGTEIYAWALMTNHAHILLRSGKEGLSKYMRRFLTGYAMFYNRRHGRHGHLFQNRYKSIVCEEDGYFLELVRYIHLNPLRAKMVKEMGQLNRYAWSGHRVIMGKAKNDWQNRDYVLGWFGRKEGDAKKKYQKFVIEGIEEGRREDLVGGGLVRSLGGWSEVKSLRKKKERVAADERILGTGGFVEKMLAEAEEKMKRQIRQAREGKKIERIIEQRCEEAKINIKELRMGSRRGRISEVRKQIIEELVKEYGYPGAEVARQVGVTTAAVSNSLRRRRGG